MKTNKKIEVTKKIALCMVALLVLVALLITSCKDLNITADIDDNDHTTVNEKDGAVVALLQKTSVTLFDGVDESDLTLTLDGQVEKLSTIIFKKYGRSVQATDTLSVTIEEIADLIEAQLAKVTIPELIEPTIDDIALINKDFQGLSEEDIIAELETIQKVYQNQIGALTLDAIVTTAEYIPEDANLVSDIPIATRAIGYSDGAFYYDDNQLTIYEIGAMLVHPFSAVNLSKQREKAFDLTAKYMGVKDRVDDKSDAFRHAILNIVMAKEGLGLKNEKMAWARDFTTAHEKGVKYIGVPSEMDLHNNNTGLRYYDANSSKKYTTFLFWKIETGVSEPSYANACESIKNKAVNAIFVNKDLGLSAARNKINAVSADYMVYIKVDDHKY